MTPDYCTDTIQLYRGDCLEVMPELARQGVKVDAVITDPPYGMNLDTDYTRFSGGLTLSAKYEPIHGDSSEFDLSHLLGFDSVIIFGLNHMCGKLPPGGCIVWQKKPENMLGTFLSVWIKGIKGVYIFPHTWSGFNRDSEVGQGYVHPTQKPVALMSYLIEKYTRPGDMVLDAYMGSGTTGVACAKLGRRFIGIERDPGYFEIAVDRIRNAAGDYQPTKKETEAGKMMFSFGGNDGIN